MGNSIILDVVQKHLDLIIAVGGAGAVLLAYVKWGRGRVMLALAWLRAAADVPRMVAFANARSRAVVGTHEIAEFEIDREGSVVWASPVACQMLGRTDTEFLGTNWVNVIHPDDRERVVGGWNDAVRNQRRYTESFRWVASDGRSIEVSAVANPVAFGGVTVTGWHAIVQRSGRGRD